VFLGARWEDGFEAGCASIIERHREARSAEATTPSSPGKSAKLRHHLRIVIAGHERVSASSRKRPGNPSNEKAKPRRKPGFLFRVPSAALFYFASARACGRQ
jgi:hypothetical protein